MPLSPSPSTPGQKLSSSLDNIFNKSFQFHSHLLNQPINYSRRNESDNSSNNISQNTNANHYRYHNHKVIKQDTFNNTPDDHDNEPTCLTKKTSSSSPSFGGENNIKKTKLSDMRKIDRIAENLRCATTKNYFDHKLPLMLPPTPATSLILKSSQVPSLQHQFLGDDAMGVPKTPENIFLDANQSIIMQSMGSNEPIQHDNALEKSLNAVTVKQANSKLYAKCFICHKQLSNQYNLRVHLETHQNVR